MQPAFDSADFIRRIGCDLVRAFGDAREATTPELVGDAMEQPVRDRLEQILPRGIGVGSGCVIDTKGGTSRQMDVVLYERDLCPVFCINNSPETTYYPCEGVMAVGEVKSAIGKSELVDAFQKIRSVKELHRDFEEMEDGLSVGRMYCGPGSTTALGFYRDRTNKGDIFGFVLAEKSTIAVTLPDPSKTHKSGPKATLLGHYAQNISEMNDDVLCPDIVAFLDGTLLVPQTIPQKEHNCADSTPYIPTRAKNVLPHIIHPARAESPFGELVKEIWKRSQGGVTTRIPLEHYLNYKAETEPNLTWAVFANVSPEQIEAQPIVTPTDHLRDDVQILGRRNI